MRKIISYLNNNKLEFLSLVIVILIGIFLRNQLSFKKFILIYAVIIIILSSIIIILRKFDLNIEKKFLVIALPIGIMMLLAIPLGNIPDERAHLARAWELSDFHLVSKISKDETTCGRELPIEIDLLFKENFNYRETKENLFLNSGKKVFMGFPNTSLYSFASYLPQIIGIWLGRLLNLPTYVTAYLGRISNFIIWIFLIYNAIKLIPFCKKIIFFIALLPISLQEGISLSPDAITFALSVFLFSYVINIIHRKGNLKKFDYALISLTCILLALCKIVYLPLCLLIILIPFKRFGSKKKKWIFIGSLASFVVFVSLLWLSCANEFLQFARFDSELQKEFILSHPFNYLMVIMRTAVYKGGEIVDGLFSYRLESFNIEMPYLTYYGNMIAFSILCYKESLSKSSCPKNMKLMIIFIVFSVFILINTSLYIQWTSPQAGMIDGIQGRYFLPIIFMIPMLFMKNDDKLKIEKDNHNNSILYYFVIVQNILAISFIIVSHLC